MKKHKVRIYKPTKLPKEKQDSINKKIKEFSKDPYISLLKNNLRKCSKITAEDLSIIVGS